MAKRTATLTPKQPSKSAKRAKSALRTEPLSSEALFTLGGDDATHALVEAEVLRRPSQRNRSPYVADIQLAGGREAICHVPSLDLGGKCVAGSTILVKPALDTKGNLVGPDAVNPWHGTPAASSTASSPSSRELAPPPVSLGEMAVAPAAVARLGEVWTGDRAKGDPPRGHGPAARTCARICRVRFGRLRARGKTVVDASVDAVSPPRRSQDLAALFPWGKQNQKGPDGERVVSARAIKHVDALAAIAKEGVASAAVLFVVARGDCSSFRPHAARCPSFAAHLKDAKKAGVTLVARRIRWDVRDGVAHAFDGGAVPVDV